MERTKAQWIQLTFSQENEPFSPVFGDRYFSKVGGIEESDYVFIRPNQLLDRWNKEEDFVIGEIGFGTGLNFFLTLDHWRKRNKGGKLIYFSFEKFPIVKDDLLILYDRILQRSSWLHPDFLSSYPKWNWGWNALNLKSENVQLNLYLGDAQEGLKERNFNVDAWYYDGFAPSRNEELWQEPLFKALAEHSRHGTTLSTFTAVGAVRRGLNEAGFQMKKMKGFGIKRDMLVGEFRPCE